MARSAASRTQDAADALLTWLNERNGAGKHVLVEPPACAPFERQTGQDAGESVTSGDLVRRKSGVRPAQDDALSAVAPAHTDWLFHLLRIEGPAAPLAELRAAAAGAGIILWHLDLDRVPDCPEHDLALEMTTLESDNALALPPLRRHHVASQGTLQQSLCEEER